MLITLRYDGLHYIQYSTYNIKFPTINLKSMKVSGMSVKSVESKAFVFQTLDAVDNLKTF